MVSNLPERGDFEQWDSGVLFEVSMDIQSDARVGLSVYYMSDSSTMWARVGYVHRDPEFTHRKFIVMDPNFVAVITPRVSAIN
jgi:hypothetical protein